jgi:uncharacterized protein (TIGR02996 family)
MDSTELALLAGVCAEPADDTARLVLADRLDETGDGERAEFIRLQIELANTPSKGHGKGPYHISGLRARESKLLRGTHGPGAKFNVCEWTGLWVSGRGWMSDGRVEFATPNANGLGEPFLYGRFARGFLDSLECSAEHWLRHADSLFWHPSQTMVCPKCNGEGATGTMVHWHACRACGGSYGVKGDGHVPRPCQPTAQPITRVTLTSEPFRLKGWPNGFMFTKGEYTFPGWPGVTFTINLSETIPGGDEPIPDAVFEGYVACGNAYVPADGWDVRLDRNLLEEVTEDIYHPVVNPRPFERSGPARISLSLTYTVSGWLARRALTMPGRGLTFGPIRGMFRGHVVEIPQAVVTDVTVLHRLPLEVTVEAIAAGEMTVIS